MKPPCGDTPTEDCGQTAAQAPGVSPAVLRVLLANHARFLAFVERRVGPRGDRRAIAEEILQEAFVRSLARGQSLRADESAVAWFYRLLRNALIDHGRRVDAERRGLAALGEEPTNEATDGELTETICACVASLVETLKPEYAVALRRVELDGESVTAYARAVGITAGNAGVRVFRARQALRRRVEESCGACAEHGCHQCECHTRRHEPTTA